MTTISVVIPAYNEEMHIRAGILTPVCKYLDDHFRASEVIVVDDGSQDMTYQAARDAGLGHMSIKHQGKAAAIIHGVFGASHQLVLVCDMDQSTPIETLGAMMQEMWPGWMVYGQRPLFRDGQAVQRRVLTVGQLFMRQMLFPELGWIDTQCGFKLWWRSDLIRVINHLSVFAENKLGSGKSANVNSGFDVECLLVARALGIGLYGMQVEWHGKSSGRVAFLRDAQRGMADLVSIFKAQLNGDYDFGRAIQTG